MDTKAIFITGGAGGMGLATGQRFAEAGWRVGFMVGNKDLVAALGRLKSYHDYGTFTPLQIAAIAALEGDQQCVKDIAATYQKRRDVMVESFGRAGWDIPSPKASMFAWAPLPPALKDMGSLEFSKQLLNLSIITSKALSTSLET